MHTMEEEIDWISGPRTLATRATQFVRTQSEVWRMKTMLAKALSLQGAAMKDAYYATSLTSAKNLQGWIHWKSV